MTPQERNTEITQQFAMMDRLNLKGYIRSVTTREGAWANDLLTNGIQECKAVLFAHLGLPATQPLGLEMSEWHRNKGNIEKADQILEITNKLNAMVDTVLDERWGLLKDLQEEYFANWEVIKSDRSDNADAVADVLAKLHASK